MRLSSVSVHEAAHIAAVEILGARTDFGTIVPTARAAGRVRFYELDLPQSDPSHEMLRERMRVRGIIALVGAIAESRVTAEPLTDVLHRQIDDLVAARGAATLIAMLADHWRADARGFVFKQLLDEAETFVDAHQHVITEVASALEYGKTLNGAQIARLVHFASNRKEQTP